jgi:hypothetical protein
MYFSKNTSCPVSLDQGAQVVPLEDPELHNRYDHPKQSLHEQHFVHATVIVSDYLRQDVVEAEEYRSYHSKHVPLDVLD